MATTKICRVCGKEYIPCRSIRPADATFNWRVVACSPKCGEEYFRQVAVSRGKVSEETEYDKTGMQSERYDGAFDENAEIETFFND